MRTSKYGKAATLILMLFYQFLILFYIQRKDGSGESVSMPGKLPEGGLLCFVGKKPGRTGGNN